MRALARADVTPRSSMSLALALASCVCLWTATPAYGEVVGAPAAALRAVSCACTQDGTLVVDARSSLASPQCACPFATRARADLGLALREAKVTPSTALPDLALAIESKWLPMKPEYESLLRYDAERYRWFLENVRCTCSGCKATVYFSHCQLSCSPAIVYKRRARVWLALGLSTDQLIDYYLREHNATHSAREQITRQWLLPKRQKSRGWMVPALLIGGVLSLLAFGIRSVVRRSRGQRSSVPEEQPLSEEERAEVLNALDDMDRSDSW